MSASLEMRASAAATDALDITPFVSKFVWRESLISGGFAWWLDFMATAWDQWDDLMMGRELNTAQFRLRVDEDTNAGVAGSQSTEWRTAVVDKSRAAFSQDISMVGGVKGADRALVMAQTVRTRAFANRTVSQVLTRIAGDHGLTTDIEATRGTRDWFQIREDNWAFARRIARLAANESGRGDTYLWIDEDRLRFRAPGVGDLSARRYDMNAVESRMDGYSTSYHGREADRRGAATLRGVGFDFATKLAVPFEMNPSTAQAQPALAPRVPRDMADGLRVFPVFERDQARVEETVRARWGRVAPRYLALRARTRADVTLRPGVPISMESNLDGARQTPFMGRYVVVEVEHVLVRGAIDTSFIAYRREAQEGDAQPTGANADIAGTRDQNQDVGLRPTVILQAQVLDG